MSTGTRPVDQSATTTTLGSPPLNSSSVDTSSSILTPTTTPTGTPPREKTSRNSESTDTTSKMEESKSDVTSIKDDVKPLNVKAEEDAEKKDKSAQTSTDVKIKVRCKKHARVKKAKVKAKRVASSDEDSSSSESSESSESSSESGDTESSSEDEDEVTRKKQKKRAKKVKAKKAAKKAKKRSKEVSESEAESDENDEEEEEEEDAVAVAQAQLDALKLARKQARAKKARRTKGSSDESEDAEKVKKSKKKKGSKTGFMRVDEVWDSKIHDYKLTETSSKSEEDEFGEYCLVVRRCFDWEGKYRNTVVDIKSKALREALSKVLGPDKSVSLVEDQPEVDPNTLFLYLEELRAHQKTLKKESKKSKTKKRQKKSSALQASHLKILIKYLDKDYAKTKKALYPLLEEGQITFDLLWALFKCNEIAYCATYSTPSEPRAFKIEYASRECSFTRGTWWEISGKYTEFDGKSFGMGNMEIDVESFVSADATFRRPS